MANTKSDSGPGLEDNLKKAVTEMLVLCLLEREDMHAIQLTQELEQRSGGAISIVFPYSALYRLISAGYIIEAYKKNAPDGRRRQYFQITEEGRTHLAELQQVYRRFSGGVELLLKGESRHEKRSNAAISSRIEKNSALPPKREKKAPIPSGGPVNGLWGGKPGVRL